MSNWIKVEYQTPQKAEMRRIARICKCSIADAFLAWFKLWRYFDHETEDGFIPYLTGADVDDIAGLELFSDALEDVGWIIISGSGVNIVNWDRHNGESAKKRAMAAERQRRRRNTR